MSELPKITSVTAPRPGVLEVVWRDGMRRQVDVSDRMRGHPLLLGLRDPEMFAKVEIDEFGTGVAWPNGADLCADALRLWAEEQDKTRRPA